MDQISLGSLYPLDGTRLAVGAYAGDGSGNILTDSGDVYLFTFTDLDFSGVQLAATIGRGYTGPKDMNLSVSILLIIWDIRLILMGIG
jgi:hypothetical protein